MCGPGRFAHRGVPLWYASVRRQDKKGGNYHGKGTFRRGLLPGRLQRGEDHRGHPDRRELRAGLLRPDGGLRDERPGGRRRQAHRHPREVIRSRECSITVCGSSQPDRGNGGGKRTGGRRIPKIGRPEFGGVKYG